MKNFLHVVLFMLCATLLGACARDLSSTTYKDSATGGKVLEGKIISARAVKVKGSDKLGENGAGMLGGGVAGGVAGSALGKGTGNTATTIGGALVGAAAGALIQETLETSDAMEYLVKIDKKYVKNAARTSKRISAKGGSAQADMTDSTDVSTKTDIISVVQATDPVLKKGARVYIIYHDDRPRLEAVE